MAEIRVPQLGESVVEATVARWLKSQGDHVETGDAVVELETEKVNVEVAAEESGTLTQVLHAEGDTVKVGEALAVIGSGQSAAQDSSGGQAVRTGPADGGVQAPPTPAASGPVDGGQGSGATAFPGVSAPPQAASAVSAQGTAASLSAAAPSSGATQAAAAAAPEAQDVVVTPVARRLAEEHGINPASLHGSGPGGRVTKEDVLERIEAPANGAARGDAATPPQVTPAPLYGHSASGVMPAGTPPPPAPAPAPPAAAPAQAASGSAPGASQAPTRGGASSGRPEERVRLSRRRLTIARRLVEAQQTAAMLTTFNEVDMTAVMDVRKRRRESFKERHGVGLGFMSFFTKAAVGALKAFPNVNAELAGDELVLKRYYDIGVAVSTDDGLVVPVLRDADSLTFAAIEQRIADLATKARERRLTLEELQGGTFTITNGGVFGSLLSTPILNPPQVAILGMHKIEERPVAVGGQVVIRPMMYLALSYDHRVIDGREAVSFLVRIKELIEDPETLLLEG